MPYIAPLLYHEYTDLHAMLDFLGRCEPDGGQMAAQYQQGRTLHAAKAACSRLTLSTLPAGSHQEASGDTDLRLCMPWSDWHALSANVLSMLVGELRLLLPAIANAPGSVGDGDNRRSEAGPSTSLLRHHFWLMLKIGLQVLKSGDTASLPDMCWALERANKGPSLMRLRSLLHTYQDHTVAHPPGHSPFREALLRHCVTTFRQWQPRRMLLPIAAVLSSGISQASSSAFNDLCATLHAGPGLPGANPGALKRQREADDLTGGRAKRIRIGLDEHNQAPAINNRPAENHGQARSTSMPAHIDPTTEQVMLRWPEHPGHAAPDQAVDLDARRKAWREAVGMVGNGQSLSRLAGARIRVPGVPAAPAHGMPAYRAPTALEIVVSVVQRKGPRL